MRRPGRLGRVLELPLPRPVQIAGMLHHHLGRDLADLDLLPLARRATGLSAADIAALIRQARSAARADRRAIDDRDLRCSPILGQDLAFSKLLSAPADRVA